MALGDRRMKRKKFVPPKVQITAMMDMLTIILIFLLTSYSDSPESLTLEKSMSLPHSTAQLAYQKNISLILTEKMLKLEDEVVGTITNGKLDGLKSDNLKDSLLFRRLDIMRHQADVKRSEMQGVQESEKVFGKEQSSDHILFFCDKNISFKTINTIIKIAGLAGYPNFQFAVLRK